MRYELSVRVSDGSGAEVPCRNNYDERDDPDQSSCDSLISSGQLSVDTKPRPVGTTSLDQGSCATDFCEVCGQYAHYCDLTCGFICVEDGITDTSLWRLQPGATDTAQAIATQLASTADKGVTFTATATGTFSLRVEDGWQGSGSVTVSGRAIGTALERSPVLVADGTRYPLTVSCTLDHCSFGYDGSPAYDGDGSGFDLLHFAEV